MRPVYQTQADSDKENAIADRFASAWGCEFAPMPKFYPVDKLIIRDKPRAWAEIKRCHRNLRQYPDVWLSLHKTVYGQQMSQVTGLPFLFLVQFDDCYAYTEIVGKYEVGYAGRKDRGDWQDMEACIEIPVDRWKVLK